MKYFKNTELAKLYHVSEKSVRNWIAAAQESKLNVELYVHNGKSYIANTAKNNITIEALVAKGKKYKNSRGLKVLKPKSAFYKTYDNKQILDIVSNITIHSEIPLQYGYSDGGAESWDLYSNRLAKEDVPNILNQTIKLLDINADYIDELLAKHKRVNIVDLGPGNGLPAKSTIERLLAQGRLNRYIAIDISQEMLDIVERNIKTWFGGKVSFEGHIRNFNEERFDDLFIQDYCDDPADMPVNLVFLFGGTLSNFRLPNHVLRVINNSLRPDDLLLYSGYMDTPYTRRYFDLSGSSLDQKDPQQSGLVPTLWNIDDSTCDFEQHFDSERSYRYKIMRPKLDLMIELKLNDKIRTIELKKGKPILLWRHRHFTAAGLVGLFNESGFDLAQATKSADQNYILLSARIKLGLD